MADIYDIPVAQASDMIRSDDSLPERIRLFSQELENLFVPEEEMEAATMELKKRYGLDKAFQRALSRADAKAILAEVGGDKEKGRKLATDRGFIF